MKDADENSNKLFSYLFFIFKNGENYVRSHSTSYAILGFSFHQKLKYPRDNERDSNYSDIIIQALMSIDATKYG